jgi:glyoxylase-like metal-dependent hydrolase (beta-lactamase superfamily II)
MVIDTMAVGPLGCNCSVLYDPTGASAVVIDPGGNFDLIKGRIERARARVVAVLHTHVHIDHMGATAPLVRWSGAQAHIHEADRVLWELMPIQAQMVGVDPPEACGLLGDLEPGSLLRFGGIELSVLHTPGHSPGSVSFVLDNGGERVAFTGDTLFRHGIGRTDLWGGDTDAIFHSIKTHLLALDDATKVVPGHGPCTTIGDERLGNPFLVRP